jgi:hypothetical protein
MILIFKKCLHPHSGVGCCCFCCCCCCCYCSIVRITACFILCFSDTFARRLTIRCGSGNLYVRTQLWLAKENVCIVRSFLFLFFLITIYLSSIIVCSIFHPAARGFPFVGLYSFRLKIWPLGYDLHIPVPTKHVIYSSCILEKGRE